MIQRRRPIESAIAERKMFNMGGMAVPMPQPTYMDLMQQGIMGMPQQPMGMPQQPQGIMASSQPLVDAIAADANNPYGGDTLSMAQGGAVGFAPGGVVIGQAPQAIQIPTLTPTVTQQGGSAVFDPTNPITMSPKSILDETSSERVQRIFPDAAANVGTLTFDREFPEFKRDEEAGRPKSYFTEGVARVLQGGRAAIRDVVSEVGQDISAISNVLFDRDTRSLVGGASSQEGLDRVTSEIGIARAVAEMIQRRPDAENQIMSLSKRIINNAKTDGTELDGQKIAEAVAYGLTTGEREQAIGYDMAQRDAERGDVDAGRSTDQGEFGGTPTAIEKPVPILQDDPDLLGKEPDSGEAAYQGLVPLSEEEETVVDKQPPVPNIAQGPAAATVDTAPSATGETTPSATGETTPDTSADAQVAEAFDKPMTKPEATKTIQDYKNKFLEAMPEYQGVSEEEKGYRFIEAGLRVMAGQSPNAIENIATGLKGLGAEFAKDEKEKRAYDRQVDLSAANYALGAIAKDVAQDRADERNRIVMYDMTDPKNPKAVSVGMDEILANDGRLPDNLVGKEIMSAKVKAANDATVRLRTLLSENAKSMRITATEANDLRDSLGNARESFVSGESGIQLLSQVKARVAAGDVTGFGSAGRELIRQAFAAAGKQDRLNQKYTNLSEAREEIRRAFQALIPISLGSTQTANSISNRDVQFLADAYVNSGFLENGVFSFATVNDETLGQQLEGAISKFRDRQKEGLADYDRVLSRINSAEQAFQDARGSGIFVSPGPFTSSYFDPITKEINPYAQKTRAFLEGRTAKPVFTYEFKDGVYRRVPAR